MSFNSILVESTYENLNFIDDIYHFIFDSIKNKKLLKISRVFNITKFIPEEYNTKKLNIFFHLRVEKSPKKEFFNAEFKNDKILINIILNFRPETLPQEQLKRLIRHEIIHALDFLRINKILFISSKKYKKYNLSQITYRKDSFEFNSMINNFKVYIKKYPNSFKAITSYDKLLNILSNSGFFSKPTKLILKDPHLRRKIFERLAREDLLPPNLKT